MSTINNVLHKKKWNTGTVQVQVEPSPIPLIKSKNDEKSDKISVKIKLPRDLRSQNLDLYEFKMDLFDNGEMEEFLLFVRNFSMTLETSGTIMDDAYIQYLYMLVRGESLCLFDALSAEVGSTTPENLTSIILGLGTYFFPIITLSKKNRAMRHGMRKF